MRPKSFLIVVLTIVLVGLIVLDVFLYVGLGNEEQLTKESFSDEKYQEILTLVREQSNYLKHQSEHTKPKKRPDVPAVNPFLKSIPIEEKITFKVSGLLNSSSKNRMVILKEKESDKVIYAKEGRTIDDVSITRLTDESVTFYYNGQTLTRRIE